MLLKNAISFSYLFIIISTVFGQSLCFDPSGDTRYETAWNCDRIVSLDVNNDGHLDIIAVTDGSGLSVHHGNGDGTFDPFLMEENYGGRDIAIEDFDNDGYTDIARLGSGGYLTIHLNDGAGGFQDPSTTEANITNSNYRDMAAADVTGDGNADVVAVDYDGDRIFVFKGDGNGAIEMIIVIQTANEPCKVALGDVNDDGVHDIACTYGAIAQASVFYSTGQDVFNAVEVYPSSFAGPQIGSLVIDDINGDSHGDLLIGGLATMHIFTGNGALQFTALSNVGMGSYAYGFVTGDWDNDGDIDPAWANDNTGGVTIRLNNGDGTFPMFGVEFYSSNGSTGDVVAGDFNEDGDQDLITATGYPGFFTFLKGHGDGSFGELSLRTGFGASGLCVEDFDLDGDMDVIGTNTSFTELALSRNDGEASFAETEYFSLSPYSIESAVSADFNEDGYADVAGQGSAGFVIALNNNGVSFEAPAVFTGTVATSGGERTVVTGDFNGDGHSDLAGTYVNSDELAVIFGNGNGTFGAPVQMATGEYPRSAFAGDLNGDAIDDIAVVANTEDEVWIYLSNGNGSFATAVILSTGLEPQGITAFDADEDGDIDLFVGCPNENHIYMYPGNGSSFGAPSTINIPTQSNAGYFDYADINDDGHLDLLTAFYQIHTAGVLFGNGDGTFQEALQFDTDQFPSIISSADFNEDGSIDLATLNTLTNNISVILNNSAFIQASGSLAFCDGESIVLSASEGFSYLWNDGNASTTQSIEVTTAGSYSCAITNQSGTCTLITPVVEVEVFQPQQVTLSLDSTLVCLENGEFFLTGGIPFGGVYSGQGVAAGTFDPVETGPGVFTITYTYEDAGSCTNASATDVIEVDICSNVIEETTSVIKLFPVVTSDEIRVAGAYSGDYNIYSSEGRLLETGRLGASSGVLHVGHFSPGVYIIVFNHNQDHLAYRIVRTNE